MNKPANVRNSDRKTRLTDQHLYTLFSSLGWLSRRPVGTLLTIGVIAIALALPAGFFVALKNVSELTHSWRQSGSISIFLKPDADLQAAKTIAEKFSSRPEVSNIDILNPDSALEDLRQTAAFADAIAGLDNNPLPYVLIVHPAKNGADQFPELTREAEMDTQVDFAQFDLQWLIRFNAMLDVGRRLIEVIAGMLLLAVLLITGNTIRLDIENRREEIEISKMLGATDAFIRRPFLYVGGWYGALGGLIALLMVSSALLLISQPVNALVDAYGGDNLLNRLNPVEMISLILIGATTGWLGAWLSVSRNLGKIQPS